eukprot:m.69318 g.69318  ORF g.69318 m.69318 type:complete len:242 (-) comp12826_c0_seq5:38-763(-)
MAALRKPGIRGLAAQQQRKEALVEKSAELKELEISAIETQLQSFKKNLEEFAKKHKTAIRQNPAFRRDFQVMCSQIGVDPLASQKGFWAELLGVGDFYYELGIQIIDACLSSRTRNGGLVEMEELKKMLQQRRDRTLGQISEDDMERAIKKLRVLGKGFAIYSNNGRKFVQSLPVELNTDHASIIAQAKNGRVTVPELGSALGWQPDRCLTSLTQLVKEGLVWLDAADDSYWFPGLFSKPS